MFRHVWYSKLVLLSFCNCFDHLLLRYRHRCGYNDLHTHEVHELSMTCIIHDIDICTIGDCFMMICTSAMPLLLCFVVRRLSVRVRCRCCCCFVVSTTICICTISLLNTLCYHCQNPSPQNIKNTNLDDS